MSLRHVEEIHIKIVQPAENTQTTRRTLHSTTKFHISKIQQKK